MKRKRRPSGTYHVTPEVRTAALSRVAWERYWGNEAEGRKAWAALKGQMPPVNLTCRRAPFWAYTEDVPEALRGDGSVEAEIDRTLDYQRCRWLLGEGKHHQRPGEAAALYRMTERLERCAPDDS